MSPRQSATPDREGIVRFAGVNGDYTRHVEPEEALAALDSLDS